MMNHKVAVVELQPELPNLGNYLCCPTYGVPLLATILKSRGFDVLALVEGISEYADSDLLEAEIVCFSTMTSSAKKTYALADTLRRQGKTVVFGGAHATFFPISSLAHADYVVRGEGDDSLPELLDALRRGIIPSDVRGISYKDGDSIIHNPDARPPCPLETVADYSLIRGFTHHRFTGWLRQTMVPVQASRGCKHRCSFCVTPKLFGGTYRKRPIAAVVEEVARAARISRQIFFVDNDFVGTTESDRDHTWKLCQRLREADYRIDATAFATVSVVQDPALLRQMYAAGIRKLCLGLESLDEHSLGCYRKSQTALDMHDSIEQLKTLGFSVFASFMAGMNGENADTVLRTVDVCIRWNIDAIYFFVLSPYPSMCHLVPPNRIILDDWDYASGHFLYFLPIAEKPSLLQHAILQGTESFYGYPRILGRLLQCRFASAFSLFLRRLAFRPVAKATRQYIRRLQEIEKGLYKSGRLDEQKLAALSRNRFVQWEQEDLLTAKETML